MMVSQNGQAGWGDVGIKSGVYVVAAEPLVGGDGAGQEERGKLTD